MSGAGSSGTRGSGKRRRSFSVAPAGDRVAIARKPSYRHKGGNGGGRRLPLSVECRRLLRVLTDDPQLGRDLAPVANLTNQQFTSYIRTLSARGLAARSGEGWVRAR